MSCFSKKDVTFRLWIDRCFLITLAMFAGFLVLALIPWTIHHEKLDLTSRWGILITLLILCIEILSSSIMGNKNVVDVILKWQKLGQKAKNFPIEHAELVALRPWAEFTLIQLAQEEQFAQRLAQEALQLPDIPESIFCDPSSVSHRSKEKEKRDRDYKRLDTSFKKKQWVLTEAWKSLTTSQEEGGIGILAYPGFEKTLNEFKIRLGPLQLKTEVKAERVMPAL